MEEKVPVLPCTPIYGKEDRINGRRGRRQLYMSGACV